jgi:hypothetical protein
MPPNKKKKEPLATESMDEQPNGLLSLVPASSPSSSSSELQSSFASG